jgi:hypothetical protein
MKMMRRKMNEGAPTETEFGITSMMSDGLLTT